MSGNLTAARKVSDENLIGGKLLIVNVTLGATPVFSSMLCPPCIACYKNFDIY